MSKVKSTYFNTKFKVKSYKQLPAKTKIIPYEPPSEETIYGKQKIKDRLAEIKKTINQYNDYIRELKKEKSDLVARLKPWVQRYESKPYHLYVLRLQNGYWYVGISRNYEKRFHRHSDGKGAYWTAIHPPIEIHEVRNLDTLDEAEAAIIEDQVTIEYAENYGHLFVRGGGYCQKNPVWPDHLLM